ncbi:MAG: Mut7-C RNAse domain-containing protein [Haloferacaceae archaeon]
MSPSSGSDPAPPDALLVDAMCGSLARHLRMCGYDAAYALDRGLEDDDRLLAVAGEEDRLVVTRDERLAARAGDRGVLLSTRDVTDQLRELARAGFALSLADPPTRCGACNGPLEPVDPDEPVPAYAPDPATTDCWRCRDCGRVFWRGSHWDDVRERLASVTDR